MLQVDDRRFPARRAITRATPASGSLWLGCRPGRTPPRGVLGSVELYLFRVWADLREHRPCEDGTVIGWNAEQWGVTRPRARRWDPQLQCAETRESDFLISLWLQVQHSCSSA